MNVKIGINTVILSALVGCAAGVVLEPFVVPPAKAETTTKWEYLCIEESQGYNVVYNIHEKSNKAGKEGWEMVMGAYNPSTNGDWVWCFKRPL